MTTTQVPNTLNLALELDIARCQFRALRTPMLRRQVAILERELREARSAKPGKATAPKRTHRRRGTKIAGLVS
jgi:hypothetical protein